MKNRYFGTLVLGLGLTALPVSAGQRQSGTPAATVQPPTEDASQSGGYPPPGAVAPNSYPSPTLTLPAGTLITVRTTEMLSSDRNRSGDTFTTVLEQPLVAQGWVVARRGQVVEGRVASALNAGRVRGVSQLAVELSQLTLVDGQQAPIRTQLVQSSGGTSHERDAAGIGAATGIGAVIGGAAGGGEGAAIGAAVGAAAGVAGVLTTRGRPTEIYPETVLSFRLEDPVTISTEQSQHAFHPVTQADYSDRGANRNRPRNFRADAYPSPYYYPPYYSPGYYYPPGFVGYYGYYGGFWPGIYVAPRVFYGRGFYRHR